MCQQQCYQEITKNNILISQKIFHSLCLNKARKFEQGIPFIIHIHVIICHLYLTLS